MDDAEERAREWLREFWEVRNGGRSGYRDKKVDLETLAALIRSERAEEREACAKGCDDAAKRYMAIDAGAESKHLQRFANAVLRIRAAAIRIRSDDDAEPHDAIRARGDADG